MMKKILAVFDGYKMSGSTLDYAIQVSKATNAHLVGVFLDERIYHSYSVYSVITTSEKPQLAIKRFDARDKKKRDNAVRKFQRVCGQAGIPYSIHRDTGIAIQELKHESMFADLVIINEYESFSKRKEASPTRFVRDLLADVQSPVLVVPASYKPIDKIVLLYDGGPSSMFAIKMFSYVLGNFEDLPVEVFTVKQRHMGSLNIPDSKLVRQYIRRHFKKATFISVRGDAEEEVPKFLSTHKENELVVLGAYRRSGFSRMFRPSMADILMKEVDTPLFIAHQ